MSGPGRLRPTQVPEDAPHDACIVGAGIAGMNALVVASGYETSSSRVALVDSRSRVGGMWVDTYDHVRLHQPHGNFTAGNIGWDLAVPRGHLASKPEVLDHFRRCLDLTGRRVTLDDRLGWTYVSHVEGDGVVVVTLEDPGGRRRELRTRRLVKAFGHRVELNDPLELSSGRIRSITPELMTSYDDEMRADSAPVWIVGGGKTAMDAAHLLITRFPGREVNLLAGPGTVFTRRDTFFPEGAARWWSGVPLNTMVRATARRFDGTNEDEVRDWFQATYGNGPIDEPRDYFGAYLSDVESAVIRRGLTTAAREYLVDAVDAVGAADGVELVLRSGGRLRTASGSWVVNCTGSLLRGARHPHEPLVSPSGKVLSLQMRSSSTGVFTSFAGYYMTHLMYRDKLLGSEILTLDVEELFTKAKALSVYASMSISMHNLSVAAEALPTKVLLDCGLDYDRWFPPHRRIPGTVDFLRTHRRDRQHHRRTLETIRDRFDVRCGPLEPG